MNFVHVDRGSLCQVVLFGHLRINECVLLPVAYRSLPRPSSPVSAKASTVRPYLLDHIIIPTIFLHEPMSTPGNRAIYNCSRSFRYLHEHFHVHFVSVFVCLLHHLVVMRTVFKDLWQPQLPFGGARDRTEDPLLARQMLSQLSYTPVPTLTIGPEWSRTTDLAIISRTL